MVSTVHQLPCWVLQPSVGKFKKYLFIVKEVGAGRYQPHYKYVISVVANAYVRLIGGKFRQYSDKMQIFRVFFSLFLFFALVSCEKELASDQQSINNSEALTDDIKQSALTVAEAMNVEPGYWITVKGYIVAAAESSIKNADFRAPFAGKTAILLADEPSDGTDDQIFDRLMPISLSDAAKGLSASFNLQENGSRWNSYVYIHGIRKQYLSAPGLKEVKNIWVGEPEEQPEPGVDPGNPSEPDNPDNPAIENINGSPVYTITQALSDASLRNHIIWVKGYIIASAKRSMGSMDFEAPFDSNSAIILAESPVTAEDIQRITEKEDYDGLFPVVLSTQYSSAKDTANLKDHPENHNQLIYIRGNFIPTSVGKLGISFAIDARFPPLQ